VGLGRRTFLSWSAVGLTISLAIGYDNFEVLAGANEMDEHFKTTDFENNMPVVLALLSVWYNNFFGAESEALIPYTKSHVPRNNGKAM
jgi:glucose-6-phosphate isomerase